MPAASSRSRTGRACSHDTERRVHVQRAVDDLRRIDDVEPVDVRLDRRDHGAVADRRDGHDVSHPRDAETQDRAPVEIGMNPGEPRLEAFAHRVVVELPVGIVLRDVARKVDEVPAAELRAPGQGGRSRRSR